jgi:hypothetical protein
LYATETQSIWEQICPRALEKGATLQNDQRAAGPKWSPGALVLAEGMVVKAKQGDSTTDAVLLDPAWTPTECKRVPGPLDRRE